MWSLSSQTGGPQRHREGTSLGASGPVLELSPQGPQPEPAGARAKTTIVTHPPPPSGPALPACPCLLLITPNPRPGRLIFLSSHPPSTAPLHLLLPVLPPQSTLLPADSFIQQSPLPFPEASGQQPWTSPLEHLRTSVPGHNSPITPGTPGRPSGAPSSQPLPSTAPGTQEEPTFASGCVRSPVTGAASSGSHLPHAGPHAAQPRQDPGQGAQAG